MFGRKPSPAAEEPAAHVGEEQDPRSPKGRPTPSRKEAEAARKQQLKIPKDPKAAKKAARERDREARAAARAPCSTTKRRAPSPWTPAPCRRP